MKKLIPFVIFFLFIFGVFLSLNPKTQQPIQASGDLKTVNNNGALYLTTTEVNTITPSSQTTVVSTGTALPITQTPITAPTGFAQDFGSLINFALQAVMVIAILLVFGSLVLGGIQWITSGGEKSKTEAARNKIISAIVGLLIVAASYAIVTLLLHFLGFSSLTEAINNVGTISNPQQTPVSATSSQLRQQNLVQ